jgi:hypothetical protein
MLQSIAIPAKLFEKFLRASQALGDLHDAFEDYLISSNPTLVRKLRKARGEHLAGGTRSFGDSVEHRSNIYRGL